MVRNNIEADFLITVKLVNELELLVLSHFKTLDISPGEALCLLLTTYNSLVVDLIKLYPLNNQLDILDKQLNLLNLTTDEMKKLQKRLKQTGKV